MLIQWKRCQRQEETHRAADQLLLCCSWTSRRRSIAWSTLRSDVWKELKELKKKTCSRWRRWSPLVESLPPQPEKPRQGLTWEVTMTVRMSWQPMLSKAWPTTWQRGVLCRLQNTSAAGCKRCSNLGTNQMSFLLLADQVIRFQEIIALPYTRLKLQHLSCDHRVGEVPGSYHSSHADWLSKQGWSPDLIECFGKRLNLGWLYRMKIISLVLVGLAATSPPILRASSLKGKNNEDDFQLLFKKVQGNTWTTR